MDLTNRPTNLAQVEVLAYNAHNAKGQTYAGIHPYGFHLADVARIASKFAVELPLYTYYDTLAAVWLHDVIEDCGWSEADVAAMTSPTTAAIVEAVSNDTVGSTDEARKARTLSKIAANRLAVFVKLCDRIANTTYSKATLGTGKSDRKFAQYCAEYPAFKVALYQHGEYPELWAAADLAHDFN
jgi:(p)ppGpp synthase/HD superfamily hydrolase